jgi:gliding motility-associated-like protein
MRKQPLRIFYLLFLWLLTSTLPAQTTTSCFRIESVLVNACGTDEGQNEMVRFLIGPNPLNTSNLNVAWTTSNSWDGLCQNAATASMVLQMNAGIVNCGLLKEPTAGVLPANSKVILISGINFSVTANPFTNLSDTLYVLFHCSTNIFGNFTNSGATLQTYSMSFGGATCSQTVSYTPSLLVGGNGAIVNYDPSGTATYVNNGCNAPTTIYDPSWTPPAPMCSGAANVDLNTLVTGTPGGYWSGPGVTGNTFSPAGLTGDQDITYTFSPNCANAVSQTETITIISWGTATWTPQTVCSGGGTINLNTLVTGTAGGAWTGTGVTGTTFDPAGLTGAIALTYTVGTGSCQAISTQNITITTSPDPAWAFAQSSICASDPSINLNTLVTGTTGGTWSGTGVTGSTFSPIGLLGNQSITYTIGSGTCTQTSSQTISITSSSNATWTPTTLCSSNGILNLNSLITGTTGGTWSGTGVTGANFDPSGFNGTQAITYSVGTGSCASSSTQNITVTTQPAQLVLTGTTSYCSGTAMTPLITIPTTGLNVYWFSDSGLMQQVGTGNSYTPTSVSATYYAVQGDAPCQSAAANISVAITQTPQPPIVPAQVQWCTGTTFPMITATSTATLISWYADAALLIPLGSGNTYQITSAATPSYFVTAQNAGCTSAPASANFIAEPLVTAQILGNPLVKACLPEVVNLQSASATGNLWSTGATSQTISVIQAGTYVLTHIGFCNTATDTVRVMDMSVDAAFNLEMEQSGLLPMPVTVVPLGNAGDQCAWYLNGEEIVLPDDATLVFTEESEQVIGHICSNQFGCADTVSKTVLVELTPTLYAPNSFTPNGDQVNDVFRISGYEITQLNVKIYDRWGEEIYVITRPEDGWNGTMSSGDLVPDGLYVYLLNARDKHSKPYRFYGSILLMR